MELADYVLNPFILAYLAVVVLGQIGLAVYRWRARAAVSARRREAGLTDEVFTDVKQRLAEVREEALTEALLLLATVVIAPFVLLLFAPTAEAKAGLATLFAALLIWILVSGTDVLKAFLGGLAFRTIVAVRRPFQAGDRVTLMNFSGKVTHIGPFHVTLMTSDDDQVSLPSAALWSEPLVTANAGERGSLCVMRFYLAPFANKAQRKMAEDCIWDAIQTSSYFDFLKPMQIFLEQTESAIVLTAKAYVARTYDEALFKSEVTQIFLDFADDNGLPLGSNAFEWMEPRE